MKQLPSSTLPIVVLGSLNMDLVVDASRAPAAGETVFGRQLTFVPGGKGANQAVAAARMGGNVAMAGRVGADEFGEQLRRGLAESGVDVAHVGRAADAVTGTALILVEDSGQNRIVIIPGANATLTPSVVESVGALIDQAEVLLVQLEIPFSVVAWAVERASATGTRVILNPAPAQKLPDGFTAKIDYLVPNEIEAALLTGIDVVDIASAALASQAMRRQGAKHVLITRGANGVLIDDPQGIRTHPAPRVHAIDTTAAGDTFIGALATALTEGKDLDAAAVFAVQAASLSVTRRGAQSSIPYRNEVEAHFRG